MKQIYDKPSITEYKVCLADVLSLSEVNYSKDWLTPLEQEQGI